MLRIALTGGIATGKSYVLRKLRERRLATIDADDVVHAALGPNTPATKAIAGQFGEAFLKPDGSVDRKLLGARVFGDRQARQALEAIIHPVVYEELRKWYGALDTAIGVASIPLLFETGHEGDFDYIVVTACTRDQQMQRLVERDGLPEKEARQRLAAQMSTEEKINRADFVVSTEGTKADTDAQVDRLLLALTQLATET
ncbi:MAG: dephospho-CoA kinase [Vicinamibacterales bacterium]|nr:dephospho-CoA kinase [Vicinamibacterales bacterium]